MAEDLNFDKDFKDEEGKIESRAIPSAIKVKEEILDLRTMAIRSYSTVVYRNSLDKSTERETAQLQGYLVGLYNILKLKFTKKKDKEDLKVLENLDQLAISKDVLDLQTLQNILNILNNKVEDLGITKIEKRRYSEDQSMA